MTGVPPVARALVVVALALRLAAAWWLGAPLLFADEGDYLDAAARLAAGDGFDPAYHRVPAYPVLLVLLGGGAGTDAAALARLAQAALAGAGAVAVWLLAVRLAGPFVAVVATALYALDPLLVTAGALLYPEAAAAVVMTLAALAVWAAADGPRLGAAAAAGALLGIAILLRPVSLATLIVLALWLAAAGRAPLGRRLAQVAVVAGAGTLVVAPWVIRGWRQHGTLVPIATAGTHTAGLAPDLAAHGLVRGIAAAARREPLAFAGRAGRELVHFFELYPTRLSTDNAAERADLHAQDPRLPSEQRFRPVIRDAVSAASFGVELGLAGVGLIFGWRRNRRATVFLTAVVLSYALGYALFIAKLRYRIPILPSLFVLAGLGAEAILARERAERHGPAVR